MAVPLEKIYYTAMRKYGMALLSGTAGIWNPISWIHTVEDIQVVSFLKGQELVIITGINKPTKPQLIDFTKSVFQAKASGLVFNIGPFIHSVPEEIIQFGKENNFPIFTLPWEVKLVDFDREFCNLIIHSENEQHNLCSAFRTAIFSPEDTKLYLPILEEEGISLEEQYCLVKFMPQVPESTEHYDNTKLFYDLRQYCEKVMNKTGKRFVIFRHDYFMTIIIPDTSITQVKNILSEIYLFSEKFYQNVTLYCAVSRCNLELDRLSECYETLSLVCKLGVKQGRKVWLWEDLGVFSLLLSIHHQEQENIEEYYQATIGPLVTYDKENGTQYCRILQLYLESNGNMQDVADTCFLHRNTISYHLKKISEMLGCNLYSMRDRVMLSIAFYIKELQG